NGDTINKIGTYSLAVLAHENNIPFYVALPVSTFDLGTETGEEVTIEERDENEVTHIGKTLITPKKIKAFNPAFDITPHKYISGFITEKGIIESDFKNQLPKLVN